MRIGYACLCMDPRFSYTTCTQAYANDDRLRSIISSNLTTLENLLAYHVEQGISMYRISSDLIPFGSSVINRICWRKEFKEEFERIGAYIREHDLRVSMHPGQYCVLNSPHPQVIERSKADLLYHALVLEAMQLDATHKMILHVGGVYGDKKAAMQRFCEQYLTLDPIIKKHLVIENDDRHYTTEDVLKLSKQLHIPVVFDNLHHTLLPCDKRLSQREWLKQVEATWNVQDGCMKVHYAQQAIGKRKGAHAMHVDTDRFLAFCKDGEGISMDVMLEVKDKNISAIKCLQLMQKTMDKNIEEWQRYHLLFLVKANTQFAFWQSFMLECRDSRTFYQMVEDIAAKPHEKNDILRVLRSVLDDLAIKSNRKALLLRTLSAYESEEKPLEQVLDAFLRACVQAQQYSCYDALLLLKTYVV